MEVVFVEFFPMTKLMDEGYTGIKIMIYTRENIKIIELVTMGNIIMEMELFIMDIGLMVFNLELDMKFGMILLNIQENIKMAKKGIGTYKWLD